MNTQFAISYHYRVVAEDIPRLSPEWRVRIQEAITQKLTTHPEVFGKPLRRSLVGYRKFRVGDYRIIFRIEKREVKVVIIGHRRDVYEFLGNRI
ncbi:MAG: type II toxin-antitoxin system RelE/ParE family toxin [bacterium]|nr:type II toxin-antitoxin system RelE/ParE family toxin [bacterium]